MKILSIKSYKYSYLIRLLTFLLFLINGSVVSCAQETKINAVTFVAPPKPFSNNAMKEIKDKNFTHICVVPYGFIKNSESEIRYNLDWQWWGEKNEGVIATIESAKANGLKTILKPQIWMHGSWVGDLNYENENKLCDWKQSYEQFILNYLDIAVSNKVDIFCIGTEFRLLAKNHPDFWETLIIQIRSKYDGLLTYSANWDDYEDVTFWDKLDFIGISAYFPLNESLTPTYENLLSEWNTQKAILKSISTKTKKPILFSEYGYLSIDGCAGKTWELEKNIENIAINESCQANALKALWDSFKNEKFWSGGVLWKWFPDGMGHEGYKEKDYTPQGKKAEEVIKSR
jgi:hypothetical protein